ncbi:DEAD/DEAH box helicase [Deinococcus metallilatus]|uniref:DEAD/DEAH box helicase n=1 Tax=Deinococcus metallilatus TaxID=1211322 RepID=A0AAE5YQB7_9DEIO|nr:DEAD/DEAH box helicase [Deinococcus metallilatus]MBB5296985.1 DEAD/DEAH box helicase domain-containing protein [Deinococcus metallilatus]QBY07877.1 DEAD/DEAH box helicase [Deinococcus metallilatus]RXJ13226.1 DEAD/DEAH box helicase [Deinococcus metallilatus]TLK23001.1 DEAD/DEAH box helicase [Deinococcus metallilatus]GMA15951.1 ATP-dependent helicase [Deinococcus metallilatus]
MLPARSSYARLEGFLRDILGGGAALLHEDEAAPARTLQAADLGWSEAVRRGFGFPEVFSHQAETYRLMSGGEHVIVTTPTASGKTGAFFPAVFERLERDPHATALFVYPLVALGQDQRDKLAAFRERGGFGWEIAAFQGNAQPGDVFRENVRMVTATPDKLHWSLTQPRVRDFLRRLAFIVLDEAHTYRGGFGSEVAGMLRRLLDLARALGAKPQVVLSTATIGNPAEFARELVGVEAVEVSESGAARHGKRYYLADHRGQPRRFWDAVVSASVQRNLKVLAFFRGRSRAARLYSTYRAQPLYRSHVHLYMAGTSDREGRLTEFRRASSGVMFATNALEAGVDIGDLEVVIIDGYPGSRMAFRQMAGRAGRVAPGLVLYLPALNEQGVPQPVDAFYSNAGNFRELVTGPIEKAVVEAENPYLSPRHRARANEEFKAAGLPAEVLPGPKYWNLRGEGSAKFAVIEAEDWAQKGPRAFDAPLESPSQHYALTEKHEGAVFTLDGQGYKVTRWEEHPAGTAILVEKFGAANLFTRGLYVIEVSPVKMGEWVRRGPLAYRHGEVVIRRRYTGFMMMRQVFERVCTGCDREPDPTERVCRACGGRIQDRMQDHKLSEHLYDEPLELPPFRTSALEVGVDARATEQPTAVAHTLKHLLQKLTPERVACDENDLAGAFRPDRDNYFFLYDDWLGGLGVSRRAFENMDDLLRRALDLTAKTCCKEAHGCYECIAVSRCYAPFLASGERRPTDKPATRAFLEGLLGVQPAPQPEPDAATLPEPPVLPASWPLQARELLDLHGLSLPEVSARLGIPSRELQRAVSTTEPLRLRHAKFGEGVFLQGFGQGDRREVLAYFPGVGQKRLLLKFAGLTVIEKAAAPVTAPGG